MRPPAMYEVREPVRGIGWIGRGYDAQKPGVRLYGGAIARKFGAPLVP
jgi:hypothetical protein